MFQTGSKEKYFECFRWNLTINGRGWQNYNEVDWANLNLLHSIFTSLPQSTLIPDLCIQLPASHFRLQISQPCPSLSHYLHNHTTARPDLSQGIEALLGQWPSQKSTNYPGPTLEHPSSQSSSISQSMFKVKITRSYSESESEESTTRLPPLRTDCLVLFSIAPFSLIPLVKTIPIKQSYCMSNPGPSCCVIVIWSCYFLI